jgi:EPS-associated MarR family transcriptional regulator
MPNKKIIIDQDIHFKILDILDKNPTITQRDLAKRIGISLGGVNFCIKALIEIGHIKINNFKRNTNKSSYLYLLTAKGLTNKIILASGFLKRKMIEYEELKKEIDELYFALNDKKKLDASPIHSFNIQTEINSKIS